VIKNSHFYTADERRHTMGDQFMVLVILVMMLIISRQFSYYRHMFKKIIFEDKIDTSLDKPLLIKDYEKLFKVDFKPYVMKFTTKINEEIFENFSYF
jgi:hypothetical protein